MGAVLAPLAQARRLAMPGASRAATRVSLAYERRAATADSSPLHRNSCWGLDWTKVLGEKVQEIGARPGYLAGLEDIVELVPQG